MNKIYLSADIEGTCGIAHWDETELNKPDWSYYRAQMTREVCAACEGAAAGGAQRVFVKDAHDSARNLIPAELPPFIEIFRGWGNDIHSMVSGIDESFAGAIFTGYHCAAGTDGNPLSHTMNTRNTAIRINGQVGSELLINTYAAAMYGVPVILVCGDATVCAQAKGLNPAIRTVAVSSGIGNGSVSIHPAEAAARIRAEAETAVREVTADPEAFRVALPAHFTVEVDFIKHFAARRASFYPGVERVSERTVRFESDDYGAVLRFFMFCL